MNIVRRSNFRIWFFTHAV